MSRPHPLKGPSDDGNPSPRPAHGTDPHPASPPASTSTGDRRPPASVRASATGFGRTFVSLRDQTIHEAPAPYRLTEWSAGPAVLTPEQARSHPSLLLRPGHAVVPFTGRASDLESLSRWRDDGADEGTAVRLVHGPGGQGKSRLAAQAARLWSADGWDVLVARHRRDHSGPAAEAARPAEGALGTLVVVDYAERWDTTGLLALLSDLRGSGTPVRVLLLARPAGHWWQVLQYRLDRDLGVPADARELGPLAPLPADRTDLFKAARDGFAEQLGVPDTEGMTPPAALLLHEAYRSVLSVHMAALTTVLAHLDGTTAPTDPTEVSAYLLARERDHWQELHEGLDRSFPTGPDTMARAVYTATLTGPLPHRAGLRALREIGVHTAEPGQVLTDHAFCYPPPADGTVLEPLRPDRLGEDFLALSTPGHAWGHPADPWADEAVAELLSGAPEDPSPPWVPAALTVLIETARRWPHIAGRLCQVLRDRPWLALRGGNGVLIALSELDVLDSALLEAVGDHLPPGPDIELDVGIAAFARRLTEDRLSRTEDAATHARLRTELGARLASAGLPPQALVEFQEAVAIYRRLDPAGYTLEQAHGLLIALGGLGHAQASLGRCEEALTNTTSAVEAFRVWASIHPAAHGPTLAWHLTSQGDQLWELRRRQEALDATEEAVGICRPLAEDADPYGGGAALGAALGALGMKLLRMDRAEEALAATAEAVTVHRRLVTADPAAHRPGLAESLFRYAKVRETLQVDTDRAATAAAEATDIYTGLAGVRQDQFAEPLRSSRRLQDDLGDTSFPAAFRRATLRQGAAYVSVPLDDAPALAAGILVSHADRCLAEGQPAKARDLLTEAVDQYRNLADSDPDPYAHELARALHLVSLAEAGLGELASALAHTTEATGLIRLLVRAGITDPPALAAVLMTNAGIRSAAGAELPLALDPAREAVELYERLADRAPATFARELALAHHLLAEILHGLGDHAAAAEILRALGTDGWGES
ncbi:tetratricopeptide repeat protein [Streptomyces sp. MH13]|uniref:tetratricopeptide repeat protein n=1 Tax=unclassified Streptomyces TaxID=2593676 RepID=UPI003CF486B8